MNEALNQIFAATVKSQEQSIGLMEKLFAVARSEAVYSQPFEAEGQTVITASEVSVGMGFGFGSGGGADGASEREAQEEAEGDQVAGAGGGGGGGGYSMGRPVAAIIINANGVRVEPIVDPTKIAIAFFTTIGSMFFMLTRMRRAR
jgi:uncharacterized spore protein YtfJ